MEELAIEILDKCFKTFENHVEKETIYDFLEDEILLEYKGLTIEVIATEVSYISDYNYNVGSIHINSIFDNNKEELLKGSTLPFIYNELNNKLFLVNRIHLGNGYLDSHKIDF